LLPSGTDAHVHPVGGRQEYWGVSGSPQGAADEEEPLPSSSPAAALEREVEEGSSEAIVAMIAPTAVAGWVWLYSATQRLYRRPSLPCTATRLLFWLEVGRCGASADSRAPPSSGQSVQISSHMPWVRGEIKPALAQRRFAAMEGWRLGGWNGGCEWIINPVVYFLETYYPLRFRYFETGPISFYSIRSR